MEAPKSAFKREVPNQAIDIEIDLEHVGSEIEVQFDEETVIEFNDDTFSEAGMVGLWTKADAATAFDDFDIEIELDD